MNEVKKTSKHTTQKTQQNNDNHETQDDNKAMLTDASCINNNESTDHNHNGIDGIGDDFNEHKIMTLIMTMY